MKTQKTNEEVLSNLRKEIRLLKQRRTENNRPTVWYNQKLGLLEVHFNNKTIISRVETIDTETSRENSDEMSKGSGFKQVVFQTMEDDE